MVISGVDIGDLQSVLLRPLSSLALFSPPDNRQLLPPMDSEVSMILPKGIVINTIGIYKEVAGYPVIPIDKVCEYWHGSLSLTCQDDVC